MKEKTILTIADVALLNERLNESARKAVGHLFQALEALAVIRDLPKAGLKLSRKDRDELARIHFLVGRLHSDTIALVQRNGVSAEA